MYGASLSNDLLDKTVTFLLVRVVLVSLPARALARFPAGLVVTWSHKGQDHSWLTDGAGNLVAADGATFDTPGAAVAAAVPGINGVNAWRELRTDGKRLADAFDALPAADDQEQEDSGADGQEDSAAAA